MDKTVVDEKKKEKASPRRFVASNLKDECQAWFPACFKFCSKQKKGKRRFFHLQKNIQSDQ
jgi:hypothetical protein